MTLQLILGVIGYAALVAAVIIIVGAGSDKT